MSSETPKPSAPSNFAQKTLQDRWKELVEVVRGAMPRHGKSLSFAGLVNIADSEVRIAFPQDAGFHRATVFGAQRAQIEASLSTKLGRRVVLIEDVSTQALEAATVSPAKQEAQVKQAREDQIESKIKGHPALQNILRVIGGTLEHIQIFEPESRVNTSVDSEFQEDETVDRVD